MNRASILLSLLIAVLTVTLWGLLNLPSDEPPWPSRVQGFSFQPMRDNHDPADGVYPSISEIDEDLALLQDETHAVRTYSVAKTLAEVPQLAAGHGLNVALGAWLDDRLESNDDEIERLVKVYGENPRNVVRVIVGNESLLREELTVGQLIDYIKRVKSRIWAPISTAEPWHVWIDHPELGEQVDFIAAHILPYWEGIPVDAAVDYVSMRHEQLKKAFPGKQIIIAEVGWPSNGRTRMGAEASLSNQTRFLRRFLKRAEKEHYIYYLMEAFDQPWKTRTEGAIGSYWGVYDTAREPKFAFTSPVVRIPQWRELAALSVVLAVITLVLLYRDSATLGSGGKGFLAIVIYLIATAAVWITYDYTRQYMTLPTVIVGIVLLLAVIGIILLLIAEAHEWAESLWLVKWRRPFPLRAVPDEELPFVSIHVPAYNEPPALLIETLNALAALDYPRFEVLVVDNNTKDPDVWRPVQSHCAGLGERFRFFHVDPLSGFKAGALNFALPETVPEAEVVAVIDADYLVRSTWLRDLAPAFADPEVAIVQAPQDYRDGGQNAFKAMCLAEFRGFFHIGMVTRNERNAIIQHGTMTMVRRTTLEAVGGWAQWCITEDAELGLRLFEAGHKALYIPTTYGRGLMPDTFADFQKQRFRWAYGAVMIMRAHIMPLLGLERTRLTRGQRYHFIAGWLPWFADGLNLVFNLAALSWSVGMVLFPAGFTPPLVTIAAIPLVLFVFKITKSFLLYRHRVTANLRQSLAAGIAGLALSHTIARAVWKGFVTRKLGFFRTPKMADAPDLIRALVAVREETLLTIAFVLAGTCVLLRDDAYMLDVRIWALVLFVQSVPYLAAMLVSTISASPSLPARLVGPMEEMRSSGAPHGRGTDDEPGRPI